MKCTRSSIRRNQIKGIDKRPRCTLGFCFKKDGIYAGGRLPNRRCPICGGRLRIPDRRYRRPARQYFKK